MSSAAVELEATVMRADGKCFLKASNAGKASIVWLMPAMCTTNKFCGSAGVSDIGWLQLGDVAPKAGVYKK